MKMTTSLKIGTALLPVLSSLIFVCPAAFAAGVIAEATKSQPRSADSPVPLEGAGKFAILAETAIADTPTSTVTGNVGLSPATGADDGLSCAEVTGLIYSADNAGPAPCSLAKPGALNWAVEAMKDAYTDAAGRKPTSTDLDGGNIGGLVLAPGVYNWSTDVNIPTSLTLNGGSNQVWIFQVAGNLDISAEQSVILQGGAQAKNIFWQVAGQTTLESDSQFEGTILDASQIAMGSGASINGRLLSETSVSLEASTVTGITQ
jgi:hypothetical protein